MTADVEVLTGRIDADIDDLVAAEIARLRQQGELEVRVERRCRVCADDSTRLLINNLLARMLSHSDIHSIINASINPVRRQRNERPITKRIVAHHAKHHFAIDNPAWAIYRRIGEERGRQLGRDYENGVAETVTHLAYLQTMVQKGWQHLIDPDTVVPYTDGASAAVKLAEIEAKSAGQQQHAEMMAQVNRIIAIFKETVPPEQWPAIVARIQGDQLPAGTGVHALAERVGAATHEDDEDDDEEEYNPTVDTDYDDEEE